MRSTSLIVAPVLALILIVLIVAAAIASTSDRNNAGVKVLVDGKPVTFDAQPRVIEGRVLVPLRGMFEALGAQVKWEAATRTITVTRDKTEIQAVIGRKTALKNGGPIVLDVPPDLINGRAYVPLRFIGESLGGTVEWQPSSRTVLIKTYPENTLPVVGSLNNLRTLLAAMSESPIVLYSEGLRIGQQGIMEDSKAVSSSVAAAPAGAGDYSATNVQVKGVDEADIVKTDGNYIYEVNKQRVVIVRAYPATDMKVVDVLRFEDDFTPQEIYVDAKHLVVIGATYQYVPLYKTPDAVAPRIYPPPSYGRNTVRVIVYDISNKSNIKKLREAELEGSYVTSRKIGTALYLVANKGFPYHIMEQAAPDLAPAYRDSAGKNEFVSIDYSQIRYFPGCVEPNYLLIAGLDLDHPGKEMKVDSYLGAGEKVYASRDNLYVAVTTYGRPVPAPAPLTAPRKLSQPVTVTGPKTTIYKFALDGGQAAYVGSGEVPGNVLNQFSMDEHEGYFRLATTTSENNVYILDAAMNTVGKLENIAPGERIYSVRFMGDRGYMVTFKTVDPLFVIDLKDPQAPKILGALKIPGYSDYLHPYDEQHIIGFGKDTVEMAQKDWRGQDIGKMAFYQGMKMALFDVSDVSHPVAKFTEIIGDRGTDSELLHNHKALLFAKDKGLLAFPITVMEIKDKTKLQPGDMPQYGQFTFQGAYVYDIDPVNGFTLRARITHLTGQDCLKAGNDWYDSDKNVNRIIYIGDTLYTLSTSMLKAHDLASLKEINSLRILDS